ncbi:hypothetical protein LTR62_007798 [Meristemomyces frigidus]|uniref:Uncharacterized protein n=1 Tax=Meristemomyces frigidus TaxID=1508187 RepID=A0AAN7TBE9_9PEZI|nr:hypothetical protein LTR62_007798 [Meristemomyces frigidus]
MPFTCPKLTPLQSRFVASCAALVLLGLVYWSLSNPHFAYAAELSYDGFEGVGKGEDHNWHRIEQQRLDEDGVDDDDDRVERSQIFTRATAATAISDNNYPNNLNIQPGNTTVWVYSNALLTSPSTQLGPGLPSKLNKDHDVEYGHNELRRRQDSGEPITIYVSINTCLQPVWNGTGVQDAEPPQLSLYVSSNAGNSEVGPTGQNQVVQLLSGGFANISVQASGDWYIAVSAPTLTTGFAGEWNYELAVSHDAYYHSADETYPKLFLVDTDHTSALLVTDNLTEQGSGSTVFQQWMNLSTPFIMFAANVENTAMLGMQNSYCGWTKNAQLTASQDDPGGDQSGIEMGMITRGLGNKPKEQFYVTNLNGSSSYEGVLAMPGNSTKSGAGVVGGGGKVWSPVHWRTKADANCALMFNLTFCDEVAYAVPNNPSKFNTTSAANDAGIDALRFIYDNYTTVNYQFFNYSLQQIACHTTSDARYSTVKTCTDCAAAYKEWLCAVSIPRCVDFSDSSSYLQARNMGQTFVNGSMLSSDLLNAPYTPMSRAPTLEGTPAYSQTYLSSIATNSSRNSIIDTLIEPGPYKELLPCEDLCYSLVQSCPAALGFGCPHPGRGLEAGYGKRDPNGTSLTCSYLGAVYDFNAGSTVFAPVFEAATIAALVALVLGLA